jgi:predicted SAM-dependent methyltransferase
MQMLHKGIGGRNSLTEKRAGEFMIQIDERSRRYLANHKIKKLQIGCGDHALSGWLNSDYMPKKPGVIHLDAKGVYPFPENTFDYVFSEHIIEHVPFSDGIAMLRESRRVLKGGGKVRIATPDLMFLHGLLSDPKSEIQEDYLRWATDRFVNDAPSCDPAFVVNNFVRSWGHQFIHSEASLRHAFQAAGFKAIERFTVSESDDDQLCKLENVARMPPSFLALESLVMEGTK